jgi:hypothetical protein
VANANRGKKGRKFVPRDFIPKWDRRPAQTWQEQLAIVRTLNRAFGGVDRTKGGSRGDPV